MNRRRRAVLLLVAAVGAGLLAVVLVSGYSTSVQGSYGELRRVVVLTRGLGPGDVISPGVAGKALGLRQVPVRFLPVGVLGDPGQAIGLEVVGPLPAGSYLTGPDLKPPQREKAKRPGAGKGRHAVELAVSGAGALTGAGRVDVLVTTDNGRGNGETKVEARRVPLLAIGPTGRSDAGPGLTEVTLGLTRSQALRLVDAQSFARRITVLPLGGG